MFNGGTHRRDRGGHGGTRTGETPRHARQGPSFGWAPPSARRTASALTEAHAHRARPSGAGVEHNEAARGTGASSDRDRDGRWAVAIDAGDQSTVAAGRGGVDAQQVDRGPPPLRYRRPKRVLKTSAGTTRHGDRTAGRAKQVVGPVGMASAAHRRPSRGLALAPPATALGRSRLTHGPRSTLRPRNIASAGDGSRRAPPAASHEPVTCTRPPAAAGWLVRAGGAGLLGRRLRKILIYFKMASPLA